MVMQVGTKVDRVVFGDVLEDDGDGECKRFFLRSRGNRANAFPSQPTLAS